MESAPQHGCSGSVLQTQVDNSFDNLVTDLNLALAYSSSISFSDIDPRTIITLMEGYKSERSDWSKYAHGNKKQCFTRNLVDRGNGKCNLVGNVELEKRSRES